MNKLFKVIWSKSKQCYIVVSEVAKNTTGKKKIVVASVLAVLAVSAQVATVQATIPEGTVKDGATVGIGQTVEVAGDSSVGVGKGITVTKRFSVAMGNGITASADNAVAIGSGANFGKVQALGNDSVAVGTRAEAGMQSSIAIGRLSRAVTGEKGVAIGNEAVTTALSAIAIGNKVKATKDTAISIGNESNATGTAAVAYGNKAQATADSTVAVGDQSKATAANATAVGTGANASGDNSIALGKSATVAGANSVALGFNTAVTAADVATGTAAGKKPYLLDSSTVDNVDDATNGIVAIGTRRDGATGFARRLTGVAGAVSDYDAVNLKQLKAVEANEWLLQTKNANDTKATDVTAQAVTGEKKKRVVLEAGDNITLENSNGTVKIKANVGVKSITSGNKTALTVSTVDTNGAVTITPNIATNLSASGDAGKLVTAGTVNTALAGKVDTNTFNTALGAKLDKTAERHVKEGSYAVQNDGTVTLTKVDGVGTEKANEAVKITGLATKASVDTLTTEVGKKQTQLT